MKVASVKSLSGLVVAVHQLQHMEGMNKDLSYEAILKKATNEPKSNVNEYIQSMVSKGVPQWDSLPLSHQVVNDRTILLRRKEINVMRFTELATHSAILLKSNNDHLSEAGQVLLADKLKDAISEISTFPVDRAQKRTLINQLKDDLVEITESPEVIRKLVSEVERNVSRSLLVGDPKVSVDNTVKSQPKNQVSGLDL